jgi:hypothetical protein
LGIICLYRPVIIERDCVEFKKITKQNKTREPTHMVGFFRANFHPQNK